MESVSLALKIIGILIGGFILLAACYAAFQIGVSIVTSALGWIVRLFPIVIGILIGLYANEINHTVLGAVIIILCIVYTFTVWLEFDFVEDWALKIEDLETLV